MSTPLFSILMANYNNGRYLQDAIDSVRAQTYERWELVIVDDCSTDDSWQRIEKLVRQDTRIRAARNPRNLRVGATKRRCVAMAHGEICGILDPDDALTPDAVERHVVEHKRLPDAGLVCSSHARCDANLTPIATVPPRGIVKLRGSYLASEQSLLHFWSFKKSVYEQTAGFDGRYAIAEDQDLWYKLEEVAPLAYLPAVLYRYRLHDGALSTGEKKAIAFAWHTKVMCRALRRRRRSGWPAKLRAEERKAVQANIANFLEWGRGRIPRTELLRQAALFCTLGAGSLRDRRLYTTLWYILRSGTGGRNAAPAAE